jgi:hypothetical protein
MVGTGMYAIRGPHSKGDLGMDSIGLIWIWVGTFSSVAGMALSVVFTKTLNHPTRMLLPISVTTRKRLANGLHR